MRGTQKECEVTLSAGGASVGWIDKYVLVKRLASLTRLVKWLSYPTLVSELTVHGGFMLNATCTISCDFFVLKYFIRYKNAEHLSSEILLDKTTKMINLISVLNMWKITNNFTLLRYSNNLCYCCSNFAFLCCSPMLDRKRVHPVIPNIGRVDKPFEVKQVMCVTRSTVGSRLSE